MSAYGRSGNALIKREAYDVALPKSLDLTDRIADAINADLENLIRPISLASRIIETARRKQRPPVPVASELDEAAVHIDAAIQLLKEEDDEREQSRLT